jgi:uncharacterized protein YfaS (alpha-2-macroglobulin family)
MMTVARTLYIGALGATTLLTSTAPLRVIRTTPDALARPNDEVTVTFDKPVAGSIERAVDPRTVIQLTPPIEGRYEWRDPVTVRFTPSAPMPRDLEVRVRVSADFTAMDGSRLEAPHEFSFRIAGPRLLETRPVRYPGFTEHLRPDQRFELVYSDAVEAAAFEQGAYIEMAANCTPRVIRLRVGGQRAITSDDGWQFEQAGGWQRDRSLDSSRRVIAVFPRAALPRNCSGELVLPEEVSAVPDRPMRRLGFGTYGDFKLIAVTACNGRPECPTGPITAQFSTPVSGAQVLRSLRIVPPVPFDVHDTLATQAAWHLSTTLKPRTAYAVTVAPTIRDAFGQRLTGNPAGGLRTSGYATAVRYPFGRQTIERVGFRTIPVEHVNVDTILALVAPVPRELEASFLARPVWGYDEAWSQVEPFATMRRIPALTARDRGSFTGVVMPTPNATMPTLMAVKFGASANGPGGGLAEAPVSLVQVTDLGVTARIGVEQGAVWVTGVNDGMPRAGAEVTLHAADGRVLATARSDAQGLARLERFAEPITGAAAEGGEEENDPEGGYVAVQLGNDRALVAVNRYDPDLSSWAFGVGSAWGTDRFPVAGALFTERGIYRPGEQVFAKAIVRNGALGSLTVPAAGDSLRWTFLDREGNELASRVVALTPFGTATESVTVAPNSAIGTNRVRVAVRRRGAWRAIATTTYRVAEFRPPEFLMDIAMRRPPSRPGTEFEVGVSGRYLFGAPMSRAAVNWEAREESVSPWDLAIPGTDGWHIGRGDWGWQEQSFDGSRTFAQGTDTLDARGEGVIRTTLPERRGGGTTRVIVAAAITDVNRQVVGNATSALVHPAAFYVAARSEGSSWFWRAADEQRISVRAVRPDGADMPGVRITGRLIRREWHRVRRERNGIAQMVGEWVIDTTATCEATTTVTATTCAMTPSGGGIHRIEFEATDADGRTALTTFGRWVSGDGFVPWSDETQFRMEVIADRDRYAVGDTATILLAAPFTDAEAWVTVEREQVIEQRRLRITSGAQTLKLPITEGFAPNAFVSIVVVRGRSAPPGKLDDPGRPTMRVGYTELRVTPEVKRLRVAVTSAKAEYRPGDTATVRLQVRDAAGRGARSEVAVWAVDQGVLALTGYKTPDPLDLVYRPRQLGLRLASNLTSVTPQVAEGEKGRREAGGGGGADGADVLRSRFKTTAFFLGTVVTDAAGDGEIRSKLPDNLTTFRLMAVAVTAGDRYGSGESPMLVSRPVVARPALPRFVRPGDQLQAGTLVNRRDGQSAPATVKATATGIRLTGDSTRTIALEPSRAGEARFQFTAQDGDSAAFRFDVRSGTEVDAVRIAVPVKPDHHPRAHTIAGVLSDTATVEFQLPADIDPARSRLTVNVGTSPLTIVRGIQRGLRVYPYACTEQISSMTAPLVALLRARDFLPEPERARAVREAQRGVDVLLSRQRADGGIGYWGSSDWTTPWLSSLAAGILVEARDVGVTVDSVALDRLATYLRSALRGESKQPSSPVSSWYDHRSTRFADQVAAADFLSRLGKPEVAAENELLRNVGFFTREDRIRFAEVLARRGERDEARRVLAPVWARVRVEGRTASLPTDSLGWYFSSTVREMARLLTATLSVDPTHELIGPLVERLTTEGRGAIRNTQDRASVVRALAIHEERTRGAVARNVTVRMGTRVVARGRSTTSDTTLALTGLLGRPRDESRSLRLSLSADGAATVPTYYYLTVTEVPTTPPVRPGGAGIHVERWYERLSDGVPVTTVEEGELVRVRLRVTVPRERQFVVLDDALPAGLEVVDLTLRTETLVGTAAPANAGRGAAEVPDEEEGEGDEEYEWHVGRWDAGHWTPWEHREMRDDRVIYSAAVLWTGTWATSYVARATTPGVFIAPPAHAEEMYNPAVNGRTAGGTFTVTARAPR